MSRLHLLSFPTTIALLALPSATAYAQPPEPAPPPPPEADVEPPPPEGPRPPPVWWIAAGGGTFEFAGNRADNVTDLGGTYELRVGASITRLLGAEVAYIGSTQSINALGLDPDARLRTNGVEALAVLNLDPYVAFDAGPVRFVPIAFAGLAYQRFSLHDEGINTSDIASTDNVIAIPLGGGLAARWARVLGDVRFTWRSTFDEDLFLTLEDPNLDDSMSHWTVTARVGVGF